MKNLNGYKVITKFVISQRCEYPGCLKDGTHAMGDPGGEWWRTGMYCYEHAIDVALYGTIKEKDEGEKKVSKKT